MTWALSAWSLIFLIWIITVIAGSDGCHTGDQFCGDMSNIAKGIAVAGLTLLWLIGLLVLLVVRFMTRPTMICPNCGGSVKGGRIACTMCGYDFTKGMNSTHVAAPRAPDAASSGFRSHSG